MYPCRVQPAVLMTWNLQGSRGVDYSAVADAVRSQAADVVLLQEVQRRQAETLAGVLGWSVEWAEKHSPLLLPAEGLAVLASSGIAQSSVVVLRGGSRTSWRRRIAVIARLAIRGLPCVVANVHLSPGEEDLERLDEVDRLVRFVHADPWQGSEEPIIAGDFNAQPPSPVSERLKSDGWLDAWEVAPRPPGHGDGATNWTPGSRRGRPPTQRLDIVFVPSAYSVIAAEVPEQYELWADVSDHLPLRVTIAFGSAPTAHV